MGKIRGYLNLKPHKDASEQATNYVTDIGSNGIFVHPEGEGPDDTQTPTGWKIADAIELFRSGVSYIKAWIDNNVPKIRVGKEDGGHVEIQSSGMKVLNGSTQYASFGATSVLGTQANGLVLGSSEMALNKSGISRFKVTADTDTAKTFTFNVESPSGFGIIGFENNPFGNATILGCTAYDQYALTNLGEVPLKADRTTEPFAYVVTDDVITLWQYTEDYSNHVITFIFDVYFPYTTANTEIGYHADETADGSVLKVGVGTSANDKKNAFEVRYNGEARVRGDVYVGCNDDSTGGAKVLSEAKIDTGEHSFSNLAANTATNISVTFSKEFATAPQVVAGLKSSLTSANTGNVAVSASNVTTTGFTLRAYNGSTAQKTIYVSWIAVGL